ncbi:MAG TPA: hypothetical protein VMB20_08400 [Candidatus Acidoferrum sp.]|nr:hypothetical protein [Candidatus Acidoferrum sp.]
MSTRIIPALAAIALAISAVPAAAQQTVERHLVYNFTVGVQNDTHDTDASSRHVNDAGGANANGTGDTSYEGIASDSGTIPVDVFGVEPDGGLVVKVSESGTHGSRNAAAVECVVYPTTNTICASGQVYPEELAVIRTLSPKFFDPSALDAKHHWHQGSDAAGVSLDFIAGPPAGTVVPISEDDNEKVSGIQGSTLHGTDTYSYDMAKSVSTQLKEYDTIRKQTGPGQYSNIVIDITAQLATDNQTAAKS